MLHRGAPPTKRPRREAQPPRPERPPGGSLPSSAASPAPALPSTCQIIKAEELRRRRAQERSRKFGNQQFVTEQGKSFLETRSVSTATAASYLKFFDGFNLWCQRSGLPTASTTELEESALVWMHEKYFEGENSHMGNTLLAALVFFRKDLQRRERQLPRVREALKGWTKLSPPRSRLPLPWKAVVLIILELVKANMLLMAQAVALTFVLYLRPSDTLSITHANIVPPAAVSLKHRGLWSVTLHAFEDELPSKTGEFDESITIDNVEFRWCELMLASLKQRRQDRVKVFNFTHAAWAREFGLACQRAGLGSLGPVVLYQLRHGGATHELVTKAREPVGLQKRGRWRTVASLRRYEKGGRLAEQISRMQPPQLARAEKLIPQIGAILCGTWKPP